MEPKDLEILQEAFNRTRDALKIAKDGEESREMARYLFRLYASGVVTVAELVRQATDARPRR